MKVTFITSYLLLGVAPMLNMSASPELGDLVTTEAPNVAPLEIMVERGHIDNAIQTIKKTNKQSIENLDAFNNKRDALDYVYDY